MSRTRTSHTTRRFCWLPLLVVASVIGAGCNGSDTSDAGDELPFVPFEAPTDMISPLPDAPTREGRWHDFLFNSLGCEVGWVNFAEFTWKPDAIGASTVTSRTDDDESERTVGFLTMRWSDEGQFARVARRMGRTMELPCLSTGYDQRTWAEPIELDGLPDGYRAVRWPESSNQVTVVLFDAASQTVMVVNWEEHRGLEHDVPTDQLVDVTNQAWTEFLANNPPLD